MPGIVTIIREDGSTISFDGEERLSFNPTATVTELPVEDGTSANDHSVKRPGAITVQAIITNTPFLPPGQTGTFGRTQEFADRLEEILGERVTLVISGETISKTFEPVVLEEMPHEVDAVDDLVFDLAFKRIRVAQAQLVSIPPEQPRRASAPGETDRRTSFPDEQDVGEQPPRRELPPEKAAEDDRSYLAQLLDGDLI